MSQDVCISWAVQPIVYYTSINANSSKARIESFKLFLAKLPFFHIIAITDTKLGSIFDYSLDRKTTGGGVALFVHNSLFVPRLQSSSGKWAGKPGLPNISSARLHLPRTHLFFLE